MEEAARRRARQAARQGRLKADRRFVGRLALALFPEPDAGRSYAIGAAGERRLGQLLDGLREHGVLALHDRRLPRSPANIDHLVTAGDGVWVVDVKLYRGRPERAWGKLRVNGRDRTKLVTGVQKQVDHVRRALGEGELPGIPVLGCLCFLDADIGLLQRPFPVDGILVTWPKPLRRRLLEGQTLAVQDRPLVLQKLAESFRAATAS
jgi:hypothetical protein